MLHFCFKKNCGREENLTRAQNSWEAKQSQIISNKINKINITVSKTRLNRTIFSILFVFLSKIVVHFLKG